MTSIRMAALAALFVSTGGMSTALAQPAAGLLENPPENMRLLCRPVTIRQAGAAVRLWRCPPRVTSALSPPRGVSNAEPDSVYAANENWSRGDGARTSDTARGETRGSAGGTRTADGSPVTGISGRGSTVDGGTSSGGVSAGGGPSVGGGTAGAGGGAGGSGSGGSSSGPPGNPGNDKGVGNSGEKHGEHAGGQGSRGASDIGGHGHDGSRGNGGGNGSNNGHGGDNGRSGEGHGGR